MPGFTRPPEWQQPADRHTRLTDPVLTVRQLSRFEFSLKHTVRIDHALVFSLPKGGYEAYLPPARPTRSEFASRRYTAVYEVDMSVHPFTDTLALPSDNDAFEFTAEVEMAWQVLDPARFVASRVTDVPVMLLSELQQAARPATRRFAINDSAAAERELVHVVSAGVPLGATVGLQVTWTLRLSRDQADIEHQRRLRAIEQSAAEQIHAVQQGLRIDLETDLRQRQQDALQLSRAMDYGRSEQELALERQRWQHERAVLHGRQELELQQLEAEKIAFYQWHLSQNGVQGWALHLAKHPEDSLLVMNNLREDQLRMIHAQMDLVKELLGEENAEKFEREGPKQLALRTVSDILTQRLPGVPQIPPLPPSAGRESASVSPHQPPPAQTPADTQLQTGMQTRLPRAAGPQAPGSPEAGKDTEDADMPSRPGPEYPPAQPPHAPPPVSCAAPPMPFGPPFTPYPSPPVPPGTPPMPSTPPSPSPWQPPPGYGSTPSAPAQSPSSPARPVVSAPAGVLEGDGTSQADDGASAGKAATEGSGS